MPVQPLPDGRVPVLLSAHDETLISQDARAILDYLDRAHEDGDPTAGDRWLLRALPIDEGYEAALAIDCGRAAVRCLQWRHP